MSETADEMRGSYTWVVSWDILPIEVSISRQSHGSHGGFAVLTIRESDRQLEQASLPHGLVFASNAALPVLQVKDALFGARGLRIEAKGMIPSPLLAGRCQPVQG